MFSKNKGIISYIAKDGSEGRLNVNIFNKKKANNLLLKQGDCYSVSSNLSFVHFKNILFDESLYFNAKDAVVIFEDCMFNGENLTIHGGSIEIINPITTSGKYIFNSFRYILDGLKEIKVCDADDFRVFIDDDKNDRVIGYNIDAKNIEIDGGQANFYSIIGDNVCLKNLEVFGSIQFSNLNNLSLCNLSFDDRFFSFSLDVRKKLYLSNINFFSIPNYVEDIVIICPSIEFDGNVLLATKNLATHNIIRINDDIYHALDGETLALDAEDLLKGSKVYNRKSFISILKGYRDLVQKVVDGEKLDDDVLKWYDKLISERKEDIKELEEDLKTLECNREFYVSNKKRRILNTKAYGYIKKGI